MPISLFLLVIISIVHYVALPILYSLFLIAFRAMIPIIRGALMNYLIPYLENRVNDSFLNNTFVVSVRDLFSPYSPESLRLY